MLFRAKPEFFHRLTRASIPEIAYRLKQHLTGYFLKYALKVNKIPLRVPEIQFSDVTSLQLPELKCVANFEAIQKLVRGETFRLNADESDIRRFENKYRDTFFADTHHSSENSDIRAVWEPARLQHATLMFLQASRAKDPENAKALCGTAKKAVFDWIRQNPFLFGPHYLSAMECGLRVYSFFHCLKAYRNLPEQESKEIAEAIYLHGWWIYRRRSLYASLGNHSICEAEGLVFAGAVYRKTTEGDRWLKEGVTLLRQELTHQIMEDGGPAEQSLNYHRFVLDLYWLTKDFLQKNKIQDLADLQTRLLKGEDFLNTIQDSGGRIPAIGDSDNGYAVAPGVAPLRHKGEKPAKDLTIFAKSGYTVLRGSNDLVFTLDHGPLGMAPLYNHGHADALSVTLHIKGAQILIDPGTYRYNGVPEWRRYFKGTRAHNTVTVDGRDQANQETSFIWSRQYDARLLKHKQTDEGVYLHASHDGYTQPVVTIWDETVQKYVIIDGFHRYFTCRNNQDIRDRNCGMLPIVVLIPDQVMVVVDTVPSFSKANGVCLGVTDIPDDGRFLDYLVPLALHLEPFCPLGIKSVPVRSPATLVPPWILKEPRGFHIRRFFAKIL